MNEKIINRHNFILNLFALFILFLLLLITRLTFASRFLFEWDSIHFAYAIKKFDILWHTPHPPGYIFYVLLARLFNYIVHDPNKALILLNIFFSWVTILIVLRLAKLIFSRKHSWISGVFLFFNPLLWFYGSVAAIYSTEAFVGALVGYISWLNIKHDSLSLYWGALAFGICGGLRQFTLMLLFPLWIYSVFIRSKTKLNFFFAILLFLSGVILWLLPTLIMAGGWKSYWASSSGQSQGGIDKLTNYFGNIIKYYFSNTLNMSIWIIFLTGLIGVIIILPVILNWLKKRKFSEIVKKEKFRFFLLWIIPPFLFYFFVFCDKPGYLLLISPAIALLFGWSLIDLSKKFSKVKGRRILIFCVVFYVFLNSAWFLFPNKSSTAQPFFSYANTNLPLPPRSDYVWDISVREIRSADRQIDQLKRLFSSGSVSNMKITPQNTVFFSKGGTPNWRRLSFYFPDFMNIWLVDQEDSGLSHFGAEAYYSKNGKVWSQTGLPFWINGKRPQIIVIDLPAETRMIFWYVSPKMKFFKSLKEKKLISGIIPLISDRQNIPFYKLKPQENISVSIFSIKN